MLISHATPWPGADLALTLESGAARWEGLCGDGLGRLCARRAVVRVSGRGVAARPRTTAVMLPGPDGALRATKRVAAPVAEPAELVSNRHVG